MKRIFTMSLIFILANTIIVGSEAFNDIEESHQNTIEYGMETNNEMVIEEIIFEENSQNNNINILEISKENCNEDIISRGDSKDYIPIQAIITAYAPYDNKSGICNDGTPDTTATGTKPKIGTLAADPKRIPYGTEIYIDGYGLGIVEDTGSALRKDKENIRIDIFMETYEEAMEWGKKEMIVYLIR